MLLNKYLIYQVILKEKGIRFFIENEKELL